MMTRMVWAVLGLASVALADNSFLLGPPGDRSETVTVMDGQGNTQFYHVNQDRGSVSITNYNTGNTSLGSWNGTDGHLIDLETGNVKFIHRSGR